MDERTQNTKSSTEEEKVVVVQLETALKALAKLLVSIRFYPAGHPSLKDVTTDAKSAFGPLFQARGSVVVIVRRTGFFYEDEPIGSANAMLQKLAAGFFARKIQRVMILKGLSCRDLWATAKVLLLDAETIHKSGGIQELLQRSKVTTIWTNIVDVKGIFELKDSIEAEKVALYGAPELADEEFLATLDSPPTADSEYTEELKSAASVEKTNSQMGEMPFDELLKSVKMAATDQEFSDLLQRLIPVLLANLTEKSAHLVLNTLSFLTHCADGERVSGAKRKASQQALAQLSIPPLLKFYIDLLCARVRLDENRVFWDMINQSLGEPLAKQLLVRLASEEDHVRRKALAEALISQGRAALNPIIATLQEDRWLVLRNASYLLGEIRDEAAVDPLRPLLRHQDLRVRCEALRALTRIGGDSVIAIIARILQGNDLELRRQAMLCLGAAKISATIPLLVQFLQIKDWRFRLLDEKIDAVNALGEIGSVDALPALIAVVNQRCVFYRRSNDELRSAALLAIGEIGGSEAIGFLEKIDKSVNPIVARAVARALKQARKGLPRD